MNGNPIQVDVIVKRVFDFLSLKEIKNCRQVCIKWSIVAEPLLRKRSKIVFNRWIRHTQNTKDKVPKDFNEIFSAAQTNVPFSSFVFRSCGACWSISELTEFFENQKSIDELEFQNIMLKNGENKKVVRYDIMDWISGFTLKKLTIKGCEAGNSTELVVSLHELGSVKVLSLVDCTANVKEGIRISPSEVKMEGITFYRDGTKLDQLRINDCIDFRKTIDIVMDNYKTECQIFDWKECGNVDYLNLNAFDTENFGFSKGSVNTLEVYDVHLTENMTVKIKALDFQRASIDLATLSPEIEKIKITSPEVLCSRPVYLPKLKSLCFVCTRDISFIPHFANCTNLVDIDISNTYFLFPSAIVLDLAWIPKSVKRMKMTGKESIVDGTEQLEVDTLLLERCSFQEADLVLARIKPKVFILMLNSYDCDESSEGAIFILNKLTNVQINQFYVGPFNWYRERFELGVFTMWVDRQGKYYKFENERGTAIEEDAFNAVDFGDWKIKNRKRWVKN